MYYNWKPSLLNCHQHKTNEWKVKNKNQPIKKIWKAMKLH